MANILVTGGAGFIGSNIVDELLSKGHSVKVLDNLSTGKESNMVGFRERIEFINGSITDKDTVKRAVEDVEVVFHQAAMVSVPRSISEIEANNNTNINGTLNILLVSRDSGVQRVIYASSSSVYGETTNPLNKETMPVQPMSPYALSKYAGERYCNLFYSLYGLKTISLRYFNVFGPRQDPASEYAAVIPKFITSILNNQPYTIFGDGEQTRDFTFVKDVVNANLIAMQTEKGFGDFFNIACQRRITLNELVQKINEITGKETRPKHVESRPGDIKHSTADITKARETLNYEPKHSFEEGLKQTIEFFRGE